MILESEPLPIVGKVVQVVECLPSKWYCGSQFKPQYYKKKKKRKEKPLPMSTCQLYLILLISTIPVLFTDFTKLIKYYVKQSEE
jgi:hypothetical protein